VNWSATMIRMIAAAFTLALASPAQAIPPAHLQPPGEIATKVREACGAAMHRVNGVCIGTPARRHARRDIRRCAAGVTC
jgi:hypothetical protein